MDIIEIVIIFICMILIAFYVKNYYYSEVEYVLSSVDDRYYLVKSLENKQEVSNLLANLNKRLMTLVNHIYNLTDDNIVKLEDRLRLYKNYNPDNISEGTNKNNYTSYSINKGEKIIFCIRSKKNPLELVKLNVLMYVAVHELAHLMTKEIGHPPIFWTNFKKLLKEAIKLKLYRKVSFKENPVDYCGIKIKSSVI